jgi:MSHA biogenesis protein MshJ
MSALRQQWQKLNARYSALSQRERVMVALALVLGPALIVNALFVDPLRGRLKSQEGSLATQSAAATQLQAEASNLQQQLNIDPDAGRKAELAALIAERDKLDARLKEFGEVLVRPEEMNGLLERLLVRNGGLRLLSLKTLAPQSVLPAGEAEGKPAERSFDLYRHGVEIRLEGSFAQLQAYLVQLEGMQQRLLWGKLEYRVIDYPRAEMSLLVYTLSPDKTWLAL